AELNFTEKQSSKASSSESRLSGSPAADNFTLSGIRFSYIPGKDNSLPGNPEEAPIYGVNTSLSFGRRSHLKGLLYSYSPRRTGKIIGEMALRDGEIKAMMESPKSG